MIFATLYKLSTGYAEGSIPPTFSPDNVRPIPALGSDGVLRFDGRYSVRHCSDLAHAHCKARGFVGFDISRGESFTKARCVQLYQSIDKG